MTPEQLRKALLEIAKGLGPAVSNIAKVVSVDENKAVCELEDEDGQKIFNVRLRPVLNGKKSYLLVPKTGTYVLAVRVEDDDDWMVVACDEIIKVGYYVDGCVFEIDDSGFLLKKENETLKKLMADLIAAIKAMSFVVSTPSGPGATTTLNNTAQFVTIENRFNQFLK